MNDTVSGTDLPFRLGILERAVAENARRLEELAQALSDKAPSEDRRRCTIVVDPDSIAPFAAGFHFREIDAAGRAYRWTGRGDFFELRIGLDREVEWTVEMELRGNDHVNLVALRAFVDYVEIPIALSGSGPFVIGPVPIRASSTVAVLTFYLPAHFVPSQLDPSSADSRTLSAVFYGLRLTPSEK